MKKQIGVVGLWHLGCVLCASWAKLGYSIHGFDFNTEIVSNLKKGTPPIFEPNLSESLADSTQKGMLDFSTDIHCLNNCDYIFVSYDTPVNIDDSSDTSIISTSIDAIKKVAKDGAVIIISSQSPVGFCKKMLTKLKKQNISLELAYSPENLRLGEAINCYMKPGRIILGTSNQRTKDNCHKLFETITLDILDMSLESAEMVKHGINSFLSMSIVFANQMADICESHEARIDDVIKGMKSDDRIGRKAYLSPGIGFSGGTLGRDLKVLYDIQDDKEEDSLFKKIYFLNQSRKNSIVYKIKKILGGLDHKTIGVLGLTYKPGTSTLRRSLPLEIVKLLSDSSCSLQVYDPRADYTEIDNGNELNISHSIEDVVKNADMLLLLTDWPEFNQYSWDKALNRMRSNFFFDAKNTLDEKKMIDFGFKYFSLGRGEK